MALAFNNQNGLPSKSVKQVNESQFLAVAGNSREETTEPRCRKE